MVKHVATDVRQSDSDHTFCGLIHKKIFSKNNKKERYIRSFFDGKTLCSKVYRVPMPICELYLPYIAVAF